MPKIWINKKGETVHPDMVRADDKMKDELVYDILEKVNEKREVLRDFKKEALQDIATYMEILRDEYGLDVTKKSNKGNITLESFDGLKKVQIAVATHIGFDEKLTFAKEKFDMYFKEITKDANGDLKTLIMKVFEVDKKGNVNVKQILSLKSYDIEHPLWIEAMAIIDDAIEVVGSKSYIRFYERKSTEDKWENISLNISDID
ncbi:MAG: DUF3164 family protein [Sulfurovum sp.]|nr:DUF3164 family protein [Sulfurovum sp.]